HGPSLRALYDLGDPSKSRVIHSGGQSGIVFSPLYRSFVAAWARVDDVPLWDAAAEHSLRLAPQR
ncbi:MAG: penicillin acylase family protein, partial [Burkholderiaceae bacterium]